MLLSLTNVRNHQDFSIELGAVTVVTGINGSGKTSILEALSLLSVASSWKTERDTEVIMWDRSFCRITGGDRDLVIQRQPYYKRFKIDEVSKRLVEVLGSMPSVVFQPEDSELIFGPPTYRRKMMDRLLSQVVPGYATALIKVQKVVRQRNRLLKMIQEGTAAADELTYWDQELAGVAVIVQEARITLVQEMEGRVAGHYAVLIGDKAQPVKLHYHRSPTYVQGASFHEHLVANRQKELAAGTTLYGPHREDILIHYAGYPASEGMSRGQARALVLAIKLAELEHIEERSGIKPLLLLDDVFAEFDRERRERIVGLCGAYQAVLSCTEVDEVRHILPKQAVCVELP